MAANPGIGMIDWDLMKPRPALEAERERLDGKCIRAWLIQRGRRGFHRAEVASELGLTPHQLNETMKALRLGTQEVIIDQTEEVV